MTSELTLSRRDVEFILSTGCRSNRLRAGHDLPGRTASTTPPCWMCTNRLPRISSNRTTRRTTVTNPHSTENASPSTRKWVSHCVHCGRRPDQRIVPQRVERHEPAQHRGAGRHGVFAGSQSGNRGLRLSHDRQRQFADGPRRARPGRPTSRPWRKGDASARCACRSRKPGRVLPISARARFRGGTAATACSATRCGSPAAITRLPRTSSTWYWPRFPMKTANFLRAFKGYRSSPSRAS